MTWTEFKQAIDKQLEENQISPDSDIWYIDISFPESDPDHSQYPMVSYSVLSQGISISDR